MYSGDILISPLDEALIILLLSAALCFIIGSPALTFCPFLTITLKSSLIKLFSLISPRYFILIILWVLVPIAASAGIIICQSTSAIIAFFVGGRPSNNSSTLGKPWVISEPATPPVWKVLMVNWVPGSPMDWAAIMPTAVPISTGRLK